jgi:hypothetical protein
MRRWSLNDVLDAERAAKKRSDARYRQQKHRSVVSSTAFQEIGSGFAVVQRAISAQSSLYCSICGCVHNRAWPCPCVRCHALHAVGSDCADSHQATVALEMPSSNAVTSDFCFICGCRHPPNADCPCNRCQSHHEADADCPVSVIQPLSICGACGNRHISVGGNLSCPCVRCHHRHPGADCPAPPRQRPAIPHSPFVNARTRERALSSNVESTPFHDCGSMTVVCPFCRARMFPHERLNCCGQGSIIVPDRNEVPSSMSTLILSAHVRSNFRIYNSIMALASIGHSNKSLVGGTFVLGGATYHRIGSMFPSNTSNAIALFSLTQHYSGANTEHKFAQIYVLDTEDATNRRLQIAPALRATTLRQLHEFMIEHNHLARSFKSAATSNAVNVTWSGNDDMEAFEVGAIIAKSGFSRDVIVTRQDGKFQSISTSHQYYHALTYPLLFPTGCSGWHPQLCYGNSTCRKITLAEYMRFLLMHRDRPSHLQRCERLTLEFLCDAQAQIEAKELQFHSLAVQQAKYRSASAKLLVQQINERHAEDIGLPVILPCGFTGSPKYYHRYAVPLDSDP